MYSAHSLLLRVWTNGTGIQKIQSSPNNNQPTHIAMRYTCPFQSTQSTNRQSGNKSKKEEVKITYWTISDQHKTESRNSILHKNILKKLEKHNFFVKQSSTDFRLKEITHQNCSSLATQAAFQLWVKSSRMTTWINKNRPDPKRETLPAGVSTALDSATHPCTSALASNTIY